MGRPKLKKTKKEIQDQKDIWAANSAKVRRERYAADPEYRAKVQDTSRNYFHRRDGIQRDRLQVCLSSLKKLDRLLTPRPMVPGEKVIDTMTAAELSDALGLSFVVHLRKWHHAGKFPRPATSVRVSRTHAEVYTGAQARRLLRVMAEHFRKKNYLTKTDTETIQALFAAM